MTIEEEIEAIEEEIRETPYNKATQQHIGRLKAKLAKLKEKQVKQGKGTHSSGGYAIKKEGDATIGLIGFPSVGKSTLLNAITNAKSEVGNYHFTTLDVIPGIMEYNEAIFQILDLPGLVQGAAAGKGRGKEVLSVARVMDLLVLMGDAHRPDVKAISQELEQMGIRLNKEPPVIVIKKRDRGGIDVASTIDLDITHETVKSIMREYGYINATIVIRTDIGVEELIDHLSGNRVYIPAIAVINKTDAVEEEHLKEIKEELKDWNPIFISAEEHIGLEDLKESMFHALDLIRVYLKPQGEKGDDEPLIIKQGSTVEEVCKKLHSDFVENFRYARIWGPTAKFPKQRVGLDHVLEEGDTLRIITG
ncbi:MAG: GTP-binding protein [Thermoplasmata archaeon]